MKITLLPVTKENGIEAIKIKPNPPDLERLHYNSHWIGHSFIHSDVQSFLVKFNSEYIGFVCFGQCYSDDYLLDKELEGIAELYQIVIKPVYQNKGYGKLVINEVLREVKNQNYKVLRVAYHPDSERASYFYKSLGFIEFGKNYDGDPYLETVV